MFTDTPLTEVDFVVRFQVSLLVEAAATDGAAVGFLSGVDQLVPLQLVGVRELLGAHRTVVPDLLFGLFQELRRNVYRDTNHFPARALLHYVVRETSRMILRSLCMPTTIWAHEVYFRDLFTWSHLKEHSHFPPVLPQRVW